MVFTIKKKQKVGYRMVVLGSVFNSRKRKVGKAFCFLLSAFQLQFNPKISELKTNLETHVD